MNSETLKIILKISPDFDQSCYEQVNKKSNWSQILLYLFDQIGFKMVELKSLLENVIQQCLNGKNVDRKTDSSLKEAFIKIKLIQGGGLTNKKQIRDILKFSSNSTTTLGCIQDMVKSIPCLAEFNSQEFCQMVEEDRQYEYFRIQAPKVEPNPQSFPARVADKTEKVQKQAEEIKSKLAAIEKSIQTMKDSVLDQHIQLHLIDALKQKLRRLTDKNEGMQEQLYNKQKYNEFKARLTQILKQFSLMSSEISKELEEDTPSLDFYQKILKIRSKIFPIFITQMQQILRKNQKCFNLIEKKDIITILGVTGAGKSTAVQMLLGYQMELVEMNEVSGELTTLMPIGGLKEQHKDFISRASQCSTTKHTSAVEIQYQTSNYTTQKLFLVDTPGFFDTGGVIVDTCNALSTIQVLKSANSIRFIFLLNQKNWGTKGQGFKNMVSMISRLFKQYYPQKIIYFLNCFHEKQLKELPLKVRDLKANLTPVQKGDTKFTQIVNHFDDLMSKAQQLAREKNITIKEAIEMSQQIIVMDPLQPNKNKIMRKIFFANRKIEKPAQLLLNIIDEKVRQILVDLANTLQHMFYEAEKLNKIDCSFYYLKQMRYLANETVDLGDISGASQKFQKIASGLEQRCAKIQKEFCKQLQNCIKYGTTDLIDERIIKKARFEDYLNSQESKNYQCISNTQNNIQKIVQQAEKRLKEKYHNDPNPNSLKAIYTFAKKFKRNQLEEQIKNSVLQKKTRIQQSLRKFLEEQQYQKVIDSLQSYKQAQSLASIIFTDLIYQNFEDAYKKKLAEMLSNSQAILNIKNKELEETSKKCQITILSQEDIKQLRKFEKFEKVTNQKNQYQKKIVSLKKDLKSKLYQLFNKYLRKIKIIQNKNQVQLMQQKFILNFKRAKQNLLQLLKIQTVRYDRLNEFNFVWQNIESFINAKAKFMVMQTKKVADNEKNIKYYSLFSMKRSLLQLSKVVNYQKQQNILSSIANSDRELIKRINSHKLKIQKISNLVNSLHLLSQILQIYGPCQYFYKHSSQTDQLGRVGKQVCDILKNKVILTLNEIKQYCDCGLVQFEQGRISLQKIPEQIKKMIKIKQFFNTAKHIAYHEEQINQFMNEIEKSFCKKSSNSYESLYNRSLNKYQQIKSYFEESKFLQKVIPKTHIEELFSLEQIIKKVEQNKEFMSLIIEEEQEDIQNLSEKHTQILKNLRTGIYQELKEKALTQIKNKQTRIFQNLLNSCSVIKFLDEYAFSQLYYFLRSQQRKSFIQEGAKEQGFEYNFDHFEKLDQFDLQLVEGHIKSLKKNQISLFKKKLVLKINNILAQQQEQARIQLSLCIQKQKNQNEEENQLSQEFHKVLRKIIDILKFIRQAAQIIKPQKLATFDKQHNFVEKLVTSMKILKNIYRKGLDDLTQRGAFNQGQNILKQIQTAKIIGKKLVDFEILTQQSINKLQFYGDSQLTFQDVLQTKRQSFNKKFMSSDLLINDNFLIEYQKFDKIVRDQINSKFQIQYLKRFKYLQSIAKKQDQNTIKEQIQKLLSRLNQLPNEMRQKIEVKVSNSENLIYSILEEEKKIAIKRYQLQNSYTLFLSQNRNYIRKIYVDLTRTQYQKIAHRIMFQLSQTKDIIEQIQKFFFFDHNLRGINKYNEYWEVIQSTSKKIFQCLTNRILSHSSDDQRFPQDIKILNYISMRQGIFPKLDSSIFHHYVDMLLNKSKQLELKANKINFQSIVGIFQSRYQIFSQWRSKSSIFVQLYQALKQLKSEQFAFEIRKFSEQIQSIKDKKQKINSEMKNLVQQIQNFSFLSLQVRFKKIEQFSSLVQQQYNSIYLMLNFYETKNEFSQFDLKQKLKEANKRIRQEQIQLNNMCEQQINKYSSIKCQSQFKERGYTNFLFRLAGAINIFKIISYSIASIVQNKFDEGFKKLEGLKKSLFKQKQEISIKYEELQKDKANRIQNLKKNKKIDEDQINKIKNQVMYKKKNIRQSLWESSKKLQQYCQILLIIHRISLQIDFTPIQNENKIKKNLETTFQFVGLEFFLVIYTKIKDFNTFSSKMILQNQPVFIQCEKYLSSKMKNQKQYVPQYSPFIMLLSPQGEKEIREFQDKFQSTYKQQLKQFEQSEKSKIEKINILIKNIQQQSRKGIDYYQNEKGGSQFQPAKLFSFLYILKSINFRIEGVNQIYQLNTLSKTEIWSLAYFISTHRPNDKKQARSLNGRLIQSSSKESNDNILALFSAYLGLSEFEVYLCLKKERKMQYIKEHKQFFERLKIMNRIKIVEPQSICGQYIQQLRIESKNFKEYVHNLINPIGILQTIKGGIKSLIASQGKKKLYKKMILFDSMEDIFSAQNLFQTFMQQIPLFDNFFSVLQEFYQNDIQQKSIGQQLIKDGLKQRILQKWQITSRNQNISNIFSYVYEGLYDALAQNEQPTLKLNGEYPYKSFKTIISYQRQKNRRISLQRQKQTLQILIGEFTFLQIIESFTSIFGFTKNYENNYRQVKDMCSRKKIFCHMLIQKNIEKIAKDEVQSFLSINLLKDTKQIVRQISKTYSSKPSKPILVIFKCLQQLFRLYNLLQQKLRASVTILMDSSRFRNIKNNIQKIFYQSSVTFIPQIELKDNLVQLIEEYSQHFDKGLLVIQTYFHQEKYLIFKSEKTNKITQHFLIKQNQLPILFQQKQEIILKFITTQLNNKEKANRKIIQQAKLQFCSFNRFLPDFSRQQKQASYNERLRKEIIQLNKFPNFVYKKKKILVLIEGSSQMKTIFLLLPNIFYNVVKQVIKLGDSIHSLKQKYLIQLCIYRNYNSNHQNILTKSLFQCSPLFLYKFLVSQNLDFTEPKAALEVGIAHVNASQSIEKVIIIAKTAPNTEEQAKNKRIKQFGEQYWRQNRFLINLDDALRNIIYKKVPIYCIYIGNDPNISTYYQNICEKTGGSIRKIISQSKIQNQLRDSIKTYLCSGK